MATWSLFSRAPGPSYELSGGLPLVAASATVRHLGVSTAVVTTPYTEAAWARLPTGGGIALRRDQRQEFGGLITERRLLWDAADRRALIKLQCVGDEQQLADRLVFPDPLRAPDDQTVNDYWTRTAAASTAMLALISDQAGPTCRADRRIPGLIIGVDPAVGPTRRWSYLFSDVLSTLAAISVASGTNLGVRVAPTADGLRADLYQPRQVAGEVKFAADLSNLVGVDYVERAPTATHAVAAGQGDLRLRTRRFAATNSSAALRWGRQIWSYIDRRDTADAQELLDAAADALAEGLPTVSVALTLTDSDAATYGLHWGLGDRVTVDVGLPGQRNVASVVDVVREIRFEVDAAGAEAIRPAVGTEDAKAVIPPPSQQRLAVIGRRLAGLITRK